MILVFIILIIGTIFSIWLFVEIPKCDDDSDSLLALAGAVILMGLCALGWIGVIYYIFIS